MRRKKKHRHRHALPAHLKGNPELVEQWKTQAGAVEKGLQEHKRTHTLQVTAANLPDIINSVESKARARNELLTAEARESVAAAAHERATRIINEQKGKKEKDAILSKPKDGTLLNRAQIAALLNLEVWRVDEECDNTKKSWSDHRPVILKIDVRCEVAESTNSGDANSNSIKEKVRLPSTQKRT